MDRPIKRKNGFSLLELLVVVLIIGLLTSIVGPRLAGQIGRSEVTTAKAQIESLDKAVQAYRLDIGRFPLGDTGLAALWRSADSDPRWRGPYLKQPAPNDPWDQPYVYRFPGSDGRDYDILSYGRDKRPGGTGDDADIRN